MHEDEHVCLCFRVSLGKIRAFLARENPPVASLISECLGAGTGCHWCVPFLRRLHEQHQRGERPDVPVTFQQYALARRHYHTSGQRDRAVLEAAGAREDESPPPNDSPPSA